jgi:hypothetical protein
MVTTQSVQVGVRIELGSLSGFPDAGRPGMPLPWQRGWARSAALRPD